MLTIRTPSRATKGPVDTLTLASSIIYLKRERDGTVSISVIVGGVLGSKGKPRSLTLLPSTQSTGSFQNRFQVLLGVISTLWALGSSLPRSRVLWGRQNVRGCWR